MRMSAVVLLSVLFYCLTVTAAVSDVIDPQSVTVVVGDMATFQCAGPGTYQVWKVNGEILVESSQKHGLSQFVVQRESNLGIYQSNLTVLATSAEDNDTTVQCVFFAIPPSLPVSSANATLTVLPGVGSIRNLNFNDVEGSISWDPPQTAGVLGNLFYQLVMINNNTGQVIVNTTTTLTSYYFTTKVCQEYVGKVTAHVGNIAGETVVQQHRIMGAYYMLAAVESEDTMVASYNVSHCAVTFSINILKYGSLEVCPDQKLISVTYPTKTPLKRTQHQVMLIEYTGVMEYTVIVDKENYCESDIMIIAENKEIENETVLFSTFDVQHCDVHTDHTSYILVECTFAINSTAPGFVLIQGTFHTGNRLQLVHDNESHKGSVNITDLPTGEYNVTVYDEMSSTVYAYTHDELLQIINEPTGSSLSFDTSTSSVLSSPAITTSTIFSSLQASVTSTMIPDSSNALPVVVSIVVAGVIATIGVVLCTLCTCLLFSLYSRKKVQNADIETVYQKEEKNRYVDRTELAMISANAATVSAVNVGQILQEQDSRDSDYESSDLEHRSDYLSDNVQEPIVTITIPSAADTTIVFPSTSAEAEKMSSSLANEIPPVTDDDMSMCTKNKKEPVYADLCHSNTGPAAPLAAATQPVIYADIKNMSSNQKNEVLPGENSPSDISQTKNDIKEPIDCESSSMECCDRIINKSVTDHNGSVNTCRYDCLYLFDCGCGYDHDCDECYSDDLYSTESDDCCDDNSSVEPSGFKMESQNSSVDNTSAFVCEPSIHVFPMGATYVLPMDTTPILPMDATYVFSMDTRKNQQLQSVQYGLMDEHNPSPTCQKIDDELVVQLATWKPIFHCDSVVPLHETPILEQEYFDISSCDIFLVGCISFENDTENDELLEGHSAMKVDKPSKSTSLVTGIAEWLYRWSTYFQKAGSLSFEHSASGSAGEKEDSIVKWRSKLFHNCYSCVSAAWITSMMASWFYKQFQLLATAVETVLQGHLVSGGSMTAVAFPKMLQNCHVMPLRY